MERVEGTFVLSDENSDHRYRSLDIFEARIHVRQFLIMFRSQQPCHSFTKGIDFGVRRDKFWRPNLNFLALNEEQQIISNVKWVSLSKNYAFILSCLSITNVCTHNSSFIYKENSLNLCMFADDYMENRILIGRLYRIISG